MVFKKIWYLLLWCRKKKAVFFSGLTLEVRAFTLFSAFIYWLELMICPPSRKSRRIIPILKDTLCTSLFWLKAAIWTLSSMGNLHVPLHGLLFWLWLIVVTPGLITASDTAQYQQSCYTKNGKPLSQLHTQSPFILHPCFSMHHSLFNKIILLNAWPWAIRRKFHFLNERFYSENLNGKLQLL